jgi:serine/threonine protein kinase
MQRDLEKTEVSVSERIIGVTGALPDALSSKYDVLGPLGVGGMAAVYKARHRVTDQLVAIKVLNQQDDLALARFMQEARTATSMSHPNIVAVYDFDSVDCIPYLVMELVEGPTLADVLRDEKTLSVERFTRLMEDVCQGLAYAHERGIVHRDIKPSNILLKKEGDREVAKIADFGIAKGAEDVSQNLTQTGEILGTPLYMSPEQCMGQAATKLSDIYALGCVMYRALTGTVPLAGTNLMETAHLRTTQSAKTFSEIKVTGVPRHIEAAVFGCLEREVADRTQDVAAVANQIGGKRVFKPIRPKPTWFKWVFKSFVAFCVIMTLLFVGFIALIVNTAEKQGLKLSFSVLSSFDGQVRTLSKTGEMAIETGQLKDARKSFALLEEIARKEKSLEWEAYALSELAQVDFREEKEGAAMIKMRRSIAIATKAFEGKSPDLVRWHTKAAQFFISMSRYTDAAGELEQSSRLLARVKGPQRERELARLIDTYKVLCERTGKTADVPALVHAIERASQQSAL